MRKQWFVWLSLVALAAWIIGLILSYTSVTCTTGATSSTASCTSGPGGVLANLFYLIGLVFTAIVWVAGMIQTARLGRWLWFVLIFLLAPITTLLYGLIGPTTVGAHPTRVEGGPIGNPLNPLHP